MGEIKDENIKNPKPKGKSTEEILKDLGYDPEDLTKGGYLPTVEELQDMIEKGAFGPDGIVISGDEGGPIPAE